MARALWDPAGENWRRHDLSRPPRRDREGEIRKQLLDRARRDRGLPGIEASRGAGPRSVRRPRRPGWDHQGWRPPAAPSSAQRGCGEAHPGPRPVGPAPPAGRSIEFLRGGGARPRAGSTAVEGPRRSRPQVLGLEANGRSPPGRTRDRGANRRREAPRRESFGSQGEDLEEEIPARRPGQDPPPGLRPASPPRSSPRDRLAAPFAPGRRARRPRRGGSRRLPRLEEDRPREEGPGPRRRGGGGAGFRRRAGPRAPCPPAEDLEARGLPLPRRGPLPPGRRRLSPSSRGRWLRLPGNGAPVPGPPTRAPGSGRRPPPADGVASPPGGGGAGLGGMVPKWT